MRCRICGLDNPEGMDFCIECGNPFRNLCAACGFDNPPRAKFCGKCAHPLTLQPPLGVSEPSPEAERRQLTVMFCDLVGSTGLAKQLDPEVLREVVREYQEGCAEILAAFDAHVAQYLGDGVLVYFGYPQAHEDDPLRAVSAGLAILDDMPRLSRRIRERGLPPLSIDVRIGVHTGPVVIGEMGAGARHELLAMGQTVNLAARLLEASEPGWLVISQATRRLIEGAFLLEGLGERALKGFPDPVPVYRVLGPSGAESRLELAAATGLTHFVGRDQEVALLVDCWEKMVEGFGQVVLVTGEPGIGKSRLLKELKGRLSGEGARWLGVRCSAFRRSSAFHPVIEVMERSLGLTPDQTAEEKIAVIVEALEGVRLDVSETLPLFASLLSVPLSEEHAPSLLSPPAQRRRTLESLCAWLLALAEETPLVVALEDLHWVDPSSLELLEMLLEQVPTTRLLVLLTARPEFEPPWMSHSYFTHLTLSRLRRNQISAMVDDITRSKKLPPEVVAEVVARTDGVPLFVEELTKMVIESDLLEEGARRYELTRSLGELAIPTTLQDSLMARLDRFGSIKELAQVASVLGREFSHDLLKAVYPMEPASFEQGLARLVAAEILYQRGVPPRSTYTFKHALIQDTAYQTLLRSRRQEYHARVARVLEEKFPESVASEPEVIGRHLEEAGLVERAISCYQRAGEKAAERSAYEESRSHFTRGLALLATLPESRERDERELLLQVAMGAPLMAVKGYGNVEVEKAYGRARVLSQKVGKGPELTRALWGLAAFYQARGDLAASEAIGRQLLEIAERSGDAALLLLANLTVGANYQYQGRWAQSLPHLERSIALHDPAVHGSLAFEYGQDPGVIARAFAAVVLWHLGYLDRSLRASEDAITLGKEGRHSFGLAFALGFSALLHQRRHDLDRALERADETIRLARDRGYALEQALGTVVRGWARALKERSEEGLEELKQGLTALSSTGAEVGSAYFLTMLAEACHALGREEEAAGVLDAALGISEARDDRFWQPEMHRLKAEILLARDPASLDEALALLRRALEQARSKESRSLELRAATRLARLLHEQGSKDEARGLLSGVHCWFTEGLESPDLRVARALLAELG